MAISNKKENGFREEIVNINRIQGVEGSSEKP